MDVYISTGNLLVKNLTFEVDSDNDSLLLTGHNEAEKVVYSDALQDYGKSLKVK